MNVRRLGVIASVLASLSSSHSTYRHYAITERKFSGKDRTKTKAARKQRQKGKSK